jgi:mannose-6-phosphate isomerase-like protein (cupin superfamily)
MARVVKPGDAKRLSLPGRLSREIVSGALGADSVSFRLVEIAPPQPNEGRRGPHVHYDFEECIFVLSGEGMTESDTGEHRLQAGDTILIPAGELHVTHATGGEPLRLLCFFPVGDVGAGTREFPSWDAARSAR